MKWIMGLLGLILIVALGVQLGWATLFVLPLAVLFVAFTLAPLAQASA